MRPARRADSSEVLVVPNVIVRMEAGHFICSVVTVQLCTVWSYECAVIDRKSVFARLPHFPCCGVRRVCAGWELDCVSCRANLCARGYDVLTQKTVAALRCRTTRCVLLCQLIIECLVHSERVSCRQLCSLTQPKWTQPLLLLRIEHRTLSIGTFFNLVKTGIWIRIRGRRKRRRLCEGHDICYHWVEQKVHCCEGSWSDGKRAAERVWQGREIDRLGCVWCYVEMLVTMRVLYKKCSEMRINGTSMVFAVGLRKTMFNYRTGRMQDLVGAYWLLASKLGCISRSRKGRK
jgi:hypothetical protein